MKIQASRLLTPIELEQMPSIVEVTKRMLASALSEKLKSAITYDEEKVHFDTLHKATIHVYKVEEIEELVLRLKHLQNIIELQGSSKLASKALLRVVRLLFEK